MISIIIPCYNSEKYIMKNLDSLIRQTNKNFKVYFIDDGSTDNTINVIEEKLSNTLVNYDIYVREHKGVGAARNFGISISSNPYIMFLDSDDYLKDNCIDSFIKEIDKYLSDIIIGEYEHEYNDKTVWSYEKSYLRLDKTLNSTEVLNLIFDNKIHVCTSNAVYKRSLFKDRSFHNKCLYHEDLNMFYKLINDSKNIKFIKSKVFVYVMRNNSLSHDLNIAKLDEGIFMLDELYYELKSNGISKKILDKIKYKVIPNTCYVFFNYLCLNESQIIQIYKDKKYFKFMKSVKLDNISTRSIIKYIRIKLIGYFPKVYIELWSFYKKKVKPLLGVKI